MFFFVWVARVSAVLCLIYVRLLSIYSGKKGLNLRRTGSFQLTFVFCFRRYSIRPFDSVKDKYS